MIRTAIALIMLATLISTAPSVSYARVPPGVSGTLSIIPGLGQLVNLDVLEAPVWFLGVTGTYVLGAKQVAFDLWMYNLYDAFRDAKPVSKRFTEKNFFVNYISTYNPLNVIDWIGFPWFSAGAYYSSRWRFTNVTPIRIFKYSFVGLGEEGLFRGFLFPGISDLTNSEIAGGIISSLLFGAAHFPQPMSAFVIRSLFGGLFCIQTVMQKWDLRHSIFVHSWWDVFVTSPDDPTGNSLSLHSSLNRKTGPIDGIGFKYTFQF